MLTNRIPWSQIEAALAPALAHKNRAGRRVESVDLFGASTHLVGEGVSTAGRPRLSIRLMASLLYLKHAFDLSDEALVERWFALITMQAIRRGSFDSVADLKRKIDAFVRHYNQHPKPFMWTATAASILSLTQGANTYTIW